MNFNTNELVKKTLIDILGEEGANEVMNRIYEIKDEIDTDERVKLPAFNSSYDTAIELLKTVSNLVHTSKFEDAFIMLNFIETNLCEQYLERYHLTEKVYEKRAWIYLKLKDTKSREYYKALTTLDGLICALYCDSFDMWRYFTTKAFINEFETDEYKKSAMDFINWVKPLAKEIKRLHRVEKKLKDKTYLDYDYENSRDLDLFVRKNNTEFNVIFDTIDIEIKRLFVLKK